MALVILAIGAIIGLVGFFMYQRSRSDSLVEAIGGVLGPIGLVIAIIGLIILMVVGITAACTCTADEKLDMYIEENAKIEQQIANLVEQYQNHEADIFTEVAPDSSVTLVSMYPELKSDELVQSQIEIYTNNNQRIKELREWTIDYEILKWWLYFG